jgi:DNA-binding NtrC family response regulator
MVIAAREPWSSITRRQSVGKPVELGAWMGEGRWALVAADDSEFQVSLRRELAGLSERLLTVHSGRDCLRVIEDRRIRFVVLDSSLSDVSGTHLVHLVGQIRPDVGVVLTFAQSDHAQECEARQAGVLFYGDRSATRDIASVLRKGLGETLLTRED